MTQLVEIPQYGDPTMDRLAESVMLIKHIADMLGAKLRSETSDQQVQDIHYRLSVLERELMDYVPPVGKITSLSNER